MYSGFIVRGRNLGVSQDTVVRACTYHVQRSPSSWRNSCSACRPFQMSFILPEVLISRACSWGLLHLSGFFSLTAINCFPDLVAKSVVSKSTLLSHFPYLSIDSPQLTNRSYLKSLPQAGPARTLSSLFLPPFPWRPRPLWRGVGVTLASVSTVAHV